MKRILIFSIVLFFFTQSRSQDKILLVTGKVLEGRVISYDEAYLQYTFKKRKELKTDMIERYRIYSTTDSANKETILYVQDSSVGNFMTQPEMKLFIAGERDALNNFKCPGYNTTGFLFGLGVSLFDTYRKADSTSNYTDKSFFNGFFRDDPTVINLIPVFLYPILAGLPPVTIRINDVTDRNNLMQEPYLEGFERVGKQKRKFVGLKYSALGSATGIALFFLAKLIQ